MSSALYAVSDEIYFLKTNEKSLNPFYRGRNFRHRKVEQCKTSSSKWQSPSNRRSVQLQRPCSQSQHSPLSKVVCSSTIEFLENLEYLKILISLTLYKICYQNSCWLVLQDLNFGSSPGNSNAHPLFENHWLMT